MIICVTAWFDKYDKFGYRTGEKEFLVSHGVDSETDENIILPFQHPEEIGAKYNYDIGEWVLP